MNTKTMNKTKLSGGWFVFLGALFWSLNAPLVKFIHMDPLLVCGLRSLIAGLVLLPFIQVKKLNFSPWMLVYILSYFSLCMGIILSLSYTSAAIAIGMQYGAMIWIFLFTAIKTRRFSKKKFFPVALIFSGVVCFMFSGLQGGNMFGNLIALTESVSFALMTVSSKKSAGENPVGLTAIANLCIGFFVFAFLPPSFGNLTSLSVHEWIVMLILGSLWVAIFLGEYPTPLVLIGFVIIIVGMLVDTLGKQSRV